MPPRLAIVPYAPSLDEISEIAVERNRHRLEAVQGVLVK